MVEPYLFRFEGVLVVSRSRIGCVEDAMDNDFDTVKGLVFGVCLGTVLWMAIIVIVAYLWAGW
jgi:hypothetical protein